MAKTSVLKLTLSCLIFYVIFASLGKVIW